MAKIDFTKMRKSISDDYKQTKKVTLRQGEVEVDCKPLTGSVFLAFAQRQGSLNLETDIELFTSIIKHGCSFTLEETNTLLENEPKASYELALTIIELTQKYTESINEEREIVKKNS